MSASRFRFEREVLKKGLTRIAGVDEAGRGPLAGPVVAAVVSFPVEWIGDGLPADLEGLNDSKQLTCAQRDEFFETLTAGRIQFGIGTADAGTIDAINI